MEEPKESEMTPKMNNPFCPFCFLHQFDVTDASVDTVYCDNCGIDVPVKDLVRL